MRKMKDTLNYAALWPPGKCDIPGYEGLYQISLNGLVRSKNKGLFDLDTPARLLCPEVTRGGYYRVTLCKGDIVQRHMVHRLMLQTYRPSLQDSEIKLHVDHIDGVRTNNCLHNLRYVTQRQNNQNTKKHRAGKLLGTIQKGSGRFQARITIDGVRVSLGTFITEQEAHEAYVKKLEELGEELL